VKAENKLTKSELNWIREHVADCSIPSKCSVCRGIEKLLRVYQDALKAPATSAGREGCEK
jgi:hypothetical protein